METLKIIDEFSSIVSIALLVFGFFFILISRNNENKNWLLTYLTCLLVMESLALFIGFPLNSNLTLLFILSFFIQFLFLTYFYYSTIFQLSSNKRNAILCLGLLPLLTYTLPEPCRSFIQYYDRAPYSFTIMVYSLMYFYALINGSISTTYSRNILNLTVLLFFTLDLFSAIGMKYFITKNLSLITYCYLFRAVFLQLFYSALIYYGWKSSKKS
jgi:hypothetical protein